MINHTTIEELIGAIVAGAPLRAETIANTLDLNTVGVHGRTPLMVAASVGSLQAVEALLRSGASVESTGIQRMTALHEASADGHTQIVACLLSAGASIDAQTADGVTPLMCAAAWGYLDVVQLLLARGADPKKVDNCGATAESVADEKGEDAAADLLTALREGTD